MTEHVTYTAPAAITKSTDDGEYTAVLWKTTDADRHGDAIKAESFDVSEYEKNPVVLWSHRHDQPIGKASRVWREGDELRATFSFGQSAKAREVAANVKAGILNAVSVGFRAVGDVLELLEFSLVAVPAHPAALIQRGVMPIKREDGTIMPDQQTTPVLAAPAKIDSTPRQYVLGKAMAAQAGLPVDAGYENEVSQELQQRSGKTDFRVPITALLGTKAQETTTPGAGVELTAESQRADLFARTGDAIRNSMVAGQAGAQVILEAEESAAVPTMSEGLTPAWQAKDADAGDTSATFASAAVVPKYLGATFVIKRSALQYSRHPDISALLQDDLRRAVASELDRVVLHGDGTTYPLEPDGISSVVATSGNVDTVEDFLAWQTPIREYDEARAAELTVVTRQAALDVWAQKNMGTDLTAVPAYRLGDDKLMGTRVLTSKVMPIATDRASSIVGLFREALLFIFGESVGVVMNPYGSQFASGGVQGRILVDANVLVRSPGAFATCAMPAVLTPAAQATSTKRKG